MAASKYLLRGLFHLFYRLECHGGANIPASGPVLVIPNHQSYLDPLLVGAMLPRPVRYMSMDRLFRWRPAGALLRYYGAFPVSTRRIDKSAVKACLGFLRRGELVMIFPEGGRSRDGRLMEFAPGFAKIALLERVPVLPVSIRGAGRAWPPSRLLPRPGKIRLTFHPPILPWTLPPGNPPRPERVVRQVQETIASGL